MFKMTKISAAALIVLGASSAFAQDDSSQQLERVTVTGSAIKRIDAESAVPVTIVKMADLKKSGVTSVEQIMANLTSVQSSTNTTQSVGSGSGGASFADMRGIGADKTLVLLNGQRIANNAVDGSAPDLNMIPFAAIDRIEVLRDGASSLYGTDAIGGVINFITRKDFQGGSLTIGFDDPQHPGGQTRSANAAFGFGDLSKQGFNLFGSLSFKNQSSINGLQRDFNKRILGGTSYSTSPANYSQDLETFYNPTQPNCSGPQVVKDGGDCVIATGNFVDFTPKTKTTSGLLKGTFQVNPDLQLGAELFSTQNNVTTTIAPVPYGGYQVNPGTAFFPTNPAIDPTFTGLGGEAGAPAYNPTSAFANPVNVQPGFVYVLWRDFPNGNRVQENKNTQNRLLLTADGSAGGWDYSVAAAYNRNKVNQYLTGGYGNGDIIGEGLLEGIINPFGDQTAAGTALLQQAGLTGLLQTAKGTVSNLNAHASRELGDWFNASRPVQIAIGAEVRHEKFESYANHDFAELVSVSTGVDPDFSAVGSRSIDAIYTELSVPVTKTLDLTGSVRYDHYSDFGGSTNPKISFRFQPSKELLVRGSVSTGFRAPTLYELNGAQAYTNTAGNYANPITCPDGSSGTQCKAQFQVLTGGNKNLTPEKSKSGTLGLVVEPLQDLSLSADLWWVQVKNMIGSISESALFNQYYQYPALQGYFNPTSGGSLSIISNCPGSACGYVDERTQNLGNLVTSGIDLGAQYRQRTSVGTFDFSLNSTYVARYSFQDFKNGYWVHNVGNFGEGGPTFRWQHNIGVNWSNQEFGAGVLVHYKSGYSDYDPSTNARVAAYTTTDLYGSWNATKAISLVVGVRNLFDKEPPFSNQEALFQAGGWDSRFTDPTGRTYYARATYAF